MFADFRKFLETQKVRIDEESFKTDEAFIRAMIHYDIDVALFGVGEARRNLIAKDPQAQLALQQFGEAQKLAQLSKSHPAKPGGRGGQ